MVLLPPIPSGPVGIGGGPMGLLTRQDGVGVSRVVCASWSGVTPPPRHYSDCSVSLPDPTRWFKSFREELRHRLRGGSWVETTGGRREARRRPGVCSRGPTVVGTGQSSPMSDSVRIFFPRTLEGGGGPDMWELGVCGTVGVVRARRGLDDPPTSPTTWTLLWSSEPV